MSPQTIFRLATAAAGVFFVALTAGFLGGWSWATALWPFTPEETRLGHIFLASITIAIGLPALWIAASGSVRSAAAGAADLVVMFAAMSLYLFARSGSDRPELALYGAGTAVLTLVLLAAFVYAQRQPWIDLRPMPRPVRGAFIVFSVILVAVATQLVRQSPSIFPWPLSPGSSVMYGFIFAGAAVYFAVGAVEGRWAAAAGQLIGFLAYDLVLIVPFSHRLATVPPEHRASLIVYIGVLVASGSLAVYYLLVNPATRVTTPAVARRAEGS